MKRFVVSVFMVMLVLSGMHAWCADESEPETGLLRVMTVPDGATIECDGVVRDVAPVTVADLPLGKHLIVARKPGYEEARKTVELTAVGQRLPVSLSLEPVRGLVLVTTEPAGAEVIVEGANRGRTPLLLTDVSLGEHRVELRLAGYHVREAVLNVDSRKPQKLDVALNSSTGTLELRSTPTGARVILNGIDRGATPCTVDGIPEGEATLELALAGCEPYRQTIRMQPGQREVMNAVLTEKPASLKVVSIPDVARVYVDDQFRGETPLTLSDLSAGSYRVRVDADGFEPLRRTVTLGRAQELVEQFRLTPNSGSIEVITAPAGVKVFVDGKESGVTLAPAGQTDRISDPLKVEGVAIGKRELSLVRKGYYTAKTSVTVERDRTATVHQTLKRRFIPNCEVITKDDKHRGVLVDIDQKGNVKLEVRPGVFLKIEAADVVARRALRELDPGEEE